MFASHAAAANQGNSGVPARWEPKKTWVFAVSVLAYPGGQGWSEEGRRDTELMAELQARGVPASQIAFIKDQQATVTAVRELFDDVLGKATADTTLWFYFAGHGTRRESGVCEFMLYDGGWPVADIFSSIERRFAGTTALLFADCCYSGSLGTEAMLRAGRVSYGVLTSSLACTVSTAAWTFTECLIAGLRGEIPLSAHGSGSLTLAELARIAEREMAVNDGQLSTFVSTNGFDPGWPLPGKRRAHPLIGEYVEARWRDGNWYPGRIENVDGGTFWVRWVGKQSGDEWIKDSDIRPFVPPQHVPGTSRRGRMARHLASRRGADRALGHASHSLRKL